MVHPGKDFKGNRTQTNIPTDPRSGVYIPNGKHRRCFFTPQMQPHTDKECSKDTHGNPILPANRHMDKNPADDGQLEHLDLPADAMIKREEQGAGCILFWYQHKIRRLSKAGGLCTDELHLAIQLELRMDCRFNDKPYVLMTTGDDLPRKSYSTYYTKTPENNVLQVVFVNHDGVAACLDPAESANCTTGYSGMQPERTVCTTHDLNTYSYIS
jgi:hypothetical protein